MLAFREPGLHFVSSPRIPEVPVHRRFALSSAPVLLLAVLACQDSTEVTAPDVADPAVQDQAPSLEALAARIPGFGGFYLDGGRPTVWLTDIAGRGAAVQALTPFMRGLGRDPAELQVRRGDYDYRQLTLWFNAASPLALDLDGTVMVDLDEARNRVLVGVENAASIGVVRAALARAGLPERSLLVEVMRPVVPVVSLQAAATPIVGGVQINFPGFLCTLGFNVVAAGQNSFITNSHCTQTQGGVQNTPYYQPLQSVNPTVIGTEVADPAYQKGVGPGCPKNKLCRLSDAARARYSTGYSNFQRGRIARPGALGSLDYTQHWTITGKGAPVVGQTVNKVGRTTGWTQGQVTNTCVNTGVSGTRFVQLCQFFVSAGVGSGDSGSPVFRIVSGSNVTLVGILWGSGGGVFVGSPIGQIEQELGTLTVN
jgi:hypothetical protein